MILSELLDHGAGGWHDAARRLGFGLGTGISSGAGWQHLIDMLRQAAELADLAFDAATSLVAGQIRDVRFKPSDSAPQQILQIVRPTRKITKPLLQPMTRLGSLVPLRLRSGKSLLQRPHFFLVTAGRRLALAAQVAELLACLPQVSRQLYRSL